MRRKQRPKKYTRTRTIRVDALHKRWMKNPKYRAEYEALAEEFALIGAMMDARAPASLRRRWPSA